MTNPIDRSEFTRLPVIINSMLFGNCVERWQMTHSERLALIALMQAIKPEVSIEVGTLHGGSLSVIAPHSKKVFSLDIKPEFHAALAGVWPNVDFITGDSAKYLPEVLQHLQLNGPPVEFVLIDGDHSYKGVKRDIEAVLAYVPTKPLWLLMHDSFLPTCRLGMQAVDWNKSPYVQFFQTDFVPGIYNAEDPPAPEGHKTMTCGLALAYITPTHRTGPVRLYAENTAFDLLLRHARNKVKGPGLRTRLGVIRRKLGL